jgi:hypothetical protein
MGVMDKVVAAVTPDPSEEKMQEARAKARAAAVNSGWLTQVLDHHLEVEDCFAAVKEANSVSTRRVAQKRLGLVLTGHSIAEESVIYPAMALTDQKPGLSRQARTHPRCRGSPRLRRRGRVLHQAARGCRSRNAVEADTSLQGRIRALRRRGRVDGSVLRIDTLGVGPQQLAPTSCGLAGQTSP